MNGTRRTEDKSSLVQRLLQGLVAWVILRPRSVLAFALVVAVASGLAAYQRLEYRTQRNDLVDPHKEYQERWQKYLAEFGDDDDIVVVVKGADSAGMRSALDSLAQAIERQPKHFDRLFYKVDLRPLAKRALLFLPTDQIERIRDNLKNMEMLLDPPVVGRFDPLFGWKSVTLYRLLHEARTRAGTIIPDKPLSADDDQFLTQLNAVSRSGAAYLRNPSDYRNPWHSLLPTKPGQQNLLAEPHYFFSDDGTLAFLLTRPVKEQDSFTACRKSIDAMRTIVAEVGGQHPDLELGLTGLPVLENDEMVASQDDSNFASCLALVGVAALYMLVFRSLWYPLLTAVTLLMGMAWAMGWLTMTVGHLNILSATFVVMLIGMGDYGVLWVTRYEQNRAAGFDVRTALLRTAAGGGPSILTAATATACAFFAAMFADFQAVAELGWIAGSGVLLCAFSCFTVMPALLSVVDRRGPIGPAAQDLANDAEPMLLPLPTVRKQASEGAKAWLPGLARRPRWVIAISMLVAAVLAVFAGRVNYDHNLLHLQARNLESVAWEMTLIQHTQGASWHALSYRASRAEALALKENYEKLPAVSRVVEVASLVPDDQVHKLALLSDIQRRLKNLPRRGSVIPHALSELRLVRTELDCLAGSLQPLADSSPQPLLQELRHGLLLLRDRIGEVPVSECAGRIREFEERLTCDLAEDLHCLRDVSTPEAITLADLPDSLRTRYVGESGKWLLRVFAKECLWEHEPLEEFASAILTVDPEATGKPFSTLEGLKSLRSGFQWAGLYAFLAIVVVFLADFRNLRHLLWALAPLALGVVISLGIMGLCGVTLNPATIIAFPLILGVGAVYGVHIVHDYLVQGATRSYTLSFLIGRAILVMALTNMISFGTLALARHRGLAGLGFILTLGVTCCMLTALVFLPAVLRVMGKKKVAKPLETQVAPRRAA